MAILKQNYNRRQLLAAVHKKLEQSDLYFGHGTDNAFDEAVWLVMHALGLSPQSEFSKLDAPVTATAISLTEQLLQQRLSTRKPLAYLLRSAWFAGLEFYIDERVIIPRSPLAELIQQQFAPWLATQPSSILDLCTGSGCIAIACANQFPDAKIVGSDISADALAVARINAAKHNLEQRIDWYQADVFNGLPQQRYDLIISNPPYVDALDMAALPAEYRHEPELALAAGQDGLNIVRQILQQATAYLQNNGILICEVGNSAAAVAACYPEIPLLWLEFANGGTGVFLVTAEQLKHIK